MEEIMVEVKIGVKVGVVKAGVNVCQLRLKGWNGMQSKVARRQEIKVRNASIGYATLSLAFLIMSALPGMSSKSLWHFEP